MHLDRHSAPDCVGVCQTGLVRESVDQGVEAVMSYTTHSFNINHAEKFGVREAVLMSHLAFWIKKNKASNKHFHDGRYWTHNSAKAFAELFPYMSNHQIRRALDKLVDEGVLVKGNFNSSAYDRTLWLAFTDAWACEVGLIDLADLPNENGEVATSVTDRNTDNPPKPPAGAALFDMFWKAYPKKVGKDAARRRFASRKPDEQLLDDMLKAIAVQHQTDQWQRGYIPNPATWLNEGRWQDETPGAQQESIGSFV